MLVNLINIFKLCQINFSLVQQWNYCLKYCNNIFYMFQKWISKIIFNTIDIGLIIKPRFLVRIFFIIKYSTYLLMKILTDLYGVDALIIKKRFYIVYQLQSIIYTGRLFIIVLAYIKKLNYSIKLLFMNATWFEREVWDLFGLYIFGQDDLRRLLTDYNFFGHPLRKDYPVIGYYELSYSFRSSSLHYYKATFAQEMRVIRGGLQW